MPARYQAVPATCIACLVLTLVATARGAAQRSPRGLDVTEEWSRRVFGETIGTAGVSVADLDGGGAMKILTSGGVDGQYYWYVVSYEDGEYRQEWASDIFPGVIHALRAVDLDGIPGAEVVVVRGAEISVFHGATPHLVRTIEMGPTVPIDDLQIADADGDGDLDFVACGNAGLFVFDVATGEEVYRMNDLACDGVAVGNVDDDSNPEIVIGHRESSLPGYVLDGATRELEWVRSPGFGRYVRTGDLDGDGRDEIVAGSDFGSSLTIYDAEQRAVAWEIPLGPAQLGDVQVLDVDGDGPPEIVWGDRHGGEVHVWDPRARDLAWSIRAGSTDRFVHGLAVGDPDGDGTNELVWGVGGSGLQVGSTLTHESEWHSDGVAGPFRGLDFGDVDFDGDPEILYASGSGTTASGGSHLFVHDARTKALERELPTAWEDLRQVRHADVDDAPQAEIFTLTGVQQDRVVSYDGLTLEEEWSWSPGGSLDALEVIDLDGDDDVEVIVGGGDRLTVLDAATGQQQWQAVPLDRNAGTFLHLRVAEVDGDPALEIVILQGFTRSLVIFDGRTHAQELQTDDLAAIAMTTADLNGDGVAEILIGSHSGRVHVVDSTSGDIVETVGGYGEAVYGLDTADLNGDLVPEIVLAYEHDIVIVDPLHPAEVLWRSGRIGSGVGLRDNLRVADLDEDGKTEILVSLGRFGLEVYQVEGIADAPPVPAGPYLESPELPGFRFKVRITAGDQEIAGIQEADCLGETVCVSGALAGRSELFLRVIGPRPNGFLWVNLVRFTPSRVEVWAEQIATGAVSYYELPALSPQDTQLTGLVDRQAFSP